MKKRRFGILISVIFVFMLAVRGDMEILNNIVDETRKSKELKEKGKLVISERVNFLNYADIKKTARKAINKILIKICCQLSVY